MGYKIEKELPFLFMAQSNTLDEDAKDEPIIKVVFMKTIGGIPHLKEVDRETAKLPQPFRKTVRYILLDKFAREFVKEHPGVAGMFFHTYDLEMRRREEERKKAMDLRRDEKELERASKYEGLE